MTNAIGYGETNEVVVTLAFPVYLGPTPNDAVVAEVLTKMFLDSGEFTGARFGRGKEKARVFVEKCAVAGSIEPGYEGIGVVRCRLVVTDRAMPRDEWRERTVTEHICDGLERLKTREFVSFEELAEKNPKEFNKRVHNIARKDFIRVMEITRMPPTLTKAPQKQAVQKT